MNKEENEKKLNEIKLERGRVATNFSFIESVIASIIGSHYLGDKKEEFISEVLEDEYFNFGLLRNLFEKIIFKKNINSL